MKPPRSFLLPCGCLLTAAAGWFLTGAFATAEAPEKRGPGLLERIAAQANPGAVPNRQEGGGGFDHLQAVVEHMDAGATTKLPAIGSLATEEAEDLARRLQGERLAAEASADPESFLARMARVDHRVRRSALAAWAANDPEGAFKAMLHTKRIGAYDGTEAYTALAQQNLAGAIALLEAAPQGYNDQDHTAWRCVFQEWAKKDVAGLQAKLSTMGARMTDAATAVGLTLSAKDPAAAIAWAETLTNKDLSGQVIGRIVDALADRDPAAAAEIYHLRPDNSPWMLANRWAQTDPAGAMRWLQAHPDSALGEAICDYCLSPVAGADPALAQKYLAGLSPSGQAQRVSMVADGMARTDPGAALQWAAALPEGQTRKLALIAAAQANADPALIPQFAALLPEAAPLLYCQTDRAAAAQAFAAMTDEQKGIAWSHLSPRVQTDPAACGIFAAMLPEGRTRSAAVCEVVLARIGVDPEGIAAWVATLPEGESRDWATENLLTNWQRFDPAGARQWEAAHLPAAKPPTKPENGNSGGGPGGVSQ